MAGRDALLNHGIVRCGVPMSAYSQVFGPAPLSSGSRAAQASMRPCRTRFHNGSVPDLVGVLDSSARPTYWTRNFDRWDYDLSRVGWRYTELPAGKSDAEDDDSAALIYDTTELGYGNGGHL